MITAERLHDVLSYDPLTGIFHWRVSLGTRRNGSRAGSFGDEGYWVIRCDGKLYKAHRLAWFYFYGKWPKGEIDHADMDRTNNAIANLRDATHTQNNANRKLRPRNGGLKGVTRRLKTGNWVAQIAMNGRKKALGTYRTAELAHEAYRQAAVEYFGEFARFE